MRSAALFPAVLALGLASAGDTRAQSLQDVIDQAAPGDTVRVDPGDYVRPVTVDKAITLLAAGPGDSRLAGLSGSLATVQGLIVDGTLAARPGTLVEAGSGLSFIACTFVGSVKGITVLDGAEDVSFTDCVLDGLVEAITLGAGVGNVTLVRTDLLDCPLGLTGPDTTVCGAGPERSPADRCQTAACARIEITDGSFTGGDRNITLAGDYVLALTNCSLEASTHAIQASGLRLEMENCVLTSIDNQGTALRLDSVSGFVRQSRILFWENGIRIGDGACPEYSDILIGGSLADANDIGNSGFNLILDQPEPVGAEYNFWGTLACSSVLSSISGQAVEKITDAGHEVVVTCMDTPVLPTSWGRLKSHFPENLPAPPSRP